MAPAATFGGENSPGAISHAVARYDLDGDGREFSTDEDGREFSTSVEEGWPKVSGVNRCVDGVMPEFTGAELEPVVRRAKLVRASSAVFTMSNHHPQPNDNTYETPGGRNRAILITASSQIPDRRTQRNPWLAKEYPFCRNVSVQSHHRHHYKNAHCNVRISPPFLGSQPPRSANILMFALSATFATTLSM